MDKITCPICFNTLRSPIQVCINGHGLCSSCQDRVPNCPLCTQKFSSSRNLLLNEILEVLPHTCKFDGCQEFVKMTDDHEKWCGYQNTFCRMTNCSWTGCGRDIIEHIKKDHSGKAITGLDHSSFYENTNLRIKQNFFSPVAAFGQFIWFHFVNNHENDVCTVSFFCVPNGKIDGSFVIRLTLGNSRKSYSFSTTVTSENCLNEEEHSILWVSSAVQCLVSSEKQLPYNINITKVQ